MDAQTRLTGLDELLCIIYGDNTQIGTLLGELGFEHAQIEQLQNGQLEHVVNELLEVIHRRLTSDSGKDTYYQVLSRRYGLDGEPRQSLSTIAEQYGYSPQYLRQLLEEILRRCQSKSWQTELKKSLKHIAVARLGGLQARPDEEQVEEKLERLSSLRNAVEFTRLDYETRQRELMKRIQPELDALAAEFQPVLDAARENLAALENEIKIEVLLCGKSISGGMYRACYTRGRVSWDNDGMSQYAESHPEVLQFRKQSPPTVSLRIKDS